MSPVSNRMLAGGGGLDTQNFIKFTSSVYLGEKRTKWKKLLVS